VKQRWFVWTPEGHIRIVEAESSRDAVIAGCEMLSERVLELGTTLRVQQVSEQSGRFDVKHERPDPAPRLMIDGERVT
jgi:hypothetical protein